MKSNYRVVIREFYPDGDIHAPVSRRATVWHLSPRDNRWGAISQETDRHLFARSMHGLRQAADNDARWQHQSVQFDLTV